MPSGRERAEARRCFLEEEHVNLPKRRQVDKGCPHGRAAVDVVRDNGELAHKRRLVLVSGSRDDERRLSSSGDNSEDSSRIATRRARLVATVLTRTYFWSSISSLTSLSQPEPAVSGLGRRSRSDRVGRGQAKPRTSAQDSS